MLIMTMPTIAYQIHHNICLKFLQKLKYGTNMNLMNQIDPNCISFQEFGQHCLVTEKFEGMTAQIREMRKIDQVITTWRQSTANRQQCATPSGSSPLQWKIGAPTLYTNPNVTTEMIILTLHHVHVAVTFLSIYLGSTVTGVKIR